MSRDSHLDKVPGFVGCRLRSSTPRAPPYFQMLHRPAANAGRGESGALGPIHKHLGSSELAGSTKWRYDSLECKPA